MRSPLMVSKTGSWASGLRHAMRDPSLLLVSSAEAVVIKDKYPKAKHHFLVLPKEDIPGIFQLRTSHLGLLSEMHLLALNAIELVGEQLADFKIGFHAQPSMQRLHLHVISTDFDSDCLKTKKHWNSFNTKLFLPYEDVVEQLKENGLIAKVEKHTAEALEKSALKCNRCSYTPKNMPELKMHLASHLRNNYFRENK